MLTMAGTAQTGLVERGRTTDLPGISAIPANLPKEMTMKLKPTLAASLFALLAALSLNASVASETAAGAKEERAAIQKKMRPHSHVEEKTGFAPKAPEAAPDKQNPAKDRTKHFHPRDGK
jgi:hypothetical protein